jgi:hypothetical protein
MASHAVTEQSKLIKIALVIFILQLYKRRNSEGKQVLFSFVGCKVE